jgi:hypothetical protein
VTVGAGGSIDTENIRDPIVGFVFDQKGRMANRTLEGAKIRKLNKEKQKTSGGSGRFGSGFPRLEEVDGLHRELQGARHHAEQPFAHRRG